MRQISYVVIVILVAFVLSLNVFRFFTFGQLDIFMTVIGLAYGLIAAFTINNTWERYGKIRDAIAEETASLVDMYNILKGFSDKDFLEKVRKEIIYYCQFDIESEWGDGEADKKSYSKFQDIFNLVMKSEVKTDKEEILFEKCIDELRDVSSSRTKQDVLSQTKLSKLQWILLLFLSLILVISVILLEMPIEATTIFISTSIITAVVLIILVIYELNSLKMAEKEFSVKPFEEVIRKTNSEK